MQNKINNDNTQLSVRGKCRICKKQNILQLKIKWDNQQQFEVEGFETFFNCDKSCNEIKKEYDIKYDFGMKTPVTGVKVIPQ